MAESHRSSGLFTPLPPEETCEVRRADVRRVCRDVRRLKKRRVTLPRLQALALAALSIAAGLGGVGLMNYYATAVADRPAAWLATVFWLILAGGVAAATVLACWRWSAADDFEDEIDRIAEDIETLDY